MAEHDGKVTFDLEIDDSRLRGDLARAIGQIRSISAQDTKIKVSADTSGALTQIKGVQAAANDLGTKRTVTVDANTASANQQLQATKGEADGLTNGTRTITVSADTTSANQQLTHTQGELNGLTNGTRQITVSAETSAADTALGATYGLQTQVDALDPHITVTADTSQADAALSSTIGLAQKSGSVGGAGASGISAAAGGGSIISTVAKGLGLKFAKEVFTAGMDYDYAMSKASTLFPEGADSQAFGAEILKLSEETGIAAPSLLESAYNALSASVPFGNASGDNLVDFLRTSSALSVAGYSSADDVTKVLGSIGNAYHGQYSPSEIANMAIKTQNKGQLTVADVVQSAPNFMSSAASQNVPLDQAMSMFAAMTLGGVQPAQSSTAINALLTELQRPQSEGYKAMQGAFADNPALKGKNLPQLMEAGVTMMDIISGMDQYMSANNLAPAAVLPGEALRAYNTLSGENMPGFQSAFEYISGPENALGTAYDTMMGTQRGKWGRFTNSLKLGMTDLALLGKPSVDLGLEGLSNPEGFFADASRGSIMGHLLKPLHDWAWAYEQGEQTTPMAPAPGTAKWGGGRSGGGGGSRGGGAGRETSWINDAGDAGETATQSAASLTTAMEDLSTDTAASAESAQAAAESQAQITEAQAAQAESQSAASESASLFASMWDASARQAQDIKGKVSKLKSALSSGAIAAGGLAGAVTNLVSSVNSAASRVAGATVTPPTATKYAVGLDYVPYDNYPALLHKGEMILTAAQASAFRVNSAGMDGGAMNAAALKAALNGMAFEIDGRRAGALVERGVSARQGVVLNRMNSRG